jgi:hypothetical protein
LKEANIDESLIKDYSAELESTIAIFNKGLDAFGEAQKALAADLMLEDTKVGAYRAYKHLEDVHEFDRQK